MIKNDGIREDKIFTIESKMKNTFENVRFTRQILLEKEIGNVLFLTAPIHSKRVEMILEKNVEEINFVMGKTTEAYYDKFSWGMSYKKNKSSFIRIFGYNL